MGSERSGEERRVKRKEGREKRAEDERRPEGERRLLS